MKDKFCIILLISTIICYKLSSQVPNDFRSKQSGNWSNAASWQTYNGTTWIDATVAPSSTDGVITILSGYTITANSDITADQVVINKSGSLNIASSTFTLNNGSGTDLLDNGTFTLSGGTQNGKGSVEITSGSVFNWTGGTYGGGGSLKIDAGASLNMNSFNHYISDSVTINNYGSWTWSSGNFYYNAYTPVINNYGTFNINTDNDFDNSNSNSGIFNNQATGVINKIGSTSNDTYFRDFASFSNKGTIHILSGVFRMYSRFINTGKIIIDTSSYFASSGGTASFTTGSSVIGAGNFNIDGGIDSLIAGNFSPTTINLNNGNSFLTAQSTLTRSSNSFFNFSNGTINGTGTLNFNSGSNFNWTGGYQTGDGITNLKAGAIFNMNSNTHYVGDARTINNYTLWNWTGGNFIYYNGNPSINNYGTFDINTDNDVDRYNANAGTFVNQSGAILNKTGSTANDTYFANIASFTNAGTINIDSGTISLVARFVNNGVINLGSNGTLNFTNNNISVINSGSSIKGSGIIIVNNNSNDSILTSNVTAKTINIYSGNLNVLAPIKIAFGNTLNLSNGALRGNSLIEFKAKSIFNWTGGYLAGNITATIDSASTFTMSGTSPHYLADTIVLNNYSTWNWAGGNLIYYNGSPIVNNYKTFNINTDYDLDNYNSSTGIFNNKIGAIINKTGDVNGETYFRDFSAINNAGTINVKSGKFQIYTNATNTGTLNIFSQSYLQFIANTIDLNSGTTFKGSGNINIDGATVNVNSPTSITTNSLNLNAGILSGASTLEMQSGSIFNWSGGYNGGSGILKIDAGATLNMNSSNSVYLSDTKQINNVGTWNWTNGNFTFYNSSPTVSNNGTFNIYTDADFNGSNNSSGTFTNQSTGIINKIGSPDDDTRFQNFGGFINAGTININSSFLTSYSRFTNTGAINAAFGAGMSFGSGIGIFNSGTSIGGDGSLNFSGGTDSVNSAIVNIKTVNISSGVVTTKSILNIKDGSTLYLSGGTLNGTGKINFNSGSVFNWAGGVLGGSDTLNLKGGSMLNVNSGNVYISDTRVLNNLGTINWTAGSIYFNGGAPSILNASVFNINTDNILNGQNSTAGKFINSNTGVINKAGSFNAETRFQNFSSFSNLGIININSGVLRSYTAFTNSGTLNVTLGSNVNFTGGIGNFNSGTNIKGSGSVFFDGGTDSINAGALTISHMYVTNGLVNSSIPLTFASGKDLNLSGGTFNSSKSINLNNGSTLNWSGGYMGGIDSINIKSGATANLVGGTVYLSDNKVLNNSGAVNWSAGNIYLYKGSASINNSGVFNINSDNTLYGTQGNVGVFNNQLNGVINKIGSPFGNSVLNSFTTFNNYGSVNINSGVLSLNANGTNNGSYNIAAGAVLTGNLNMSFLGNQIVNNGAVLISGLSFSDTSAQTLKGNGTINSLTINNIQGLAVTGKQIVSGTLNLSAGNINLGDSDLILTSNASLTGGSNTSYVVTRNKGSLQRYIINNNSNNVFPIGTTSSYMPATIKLASSSVNDNFKARVLSNLYSDFDSSGNSVGSSITQNSVGNTWMISESTSGGTNASVTLQWNSNNELAGFERTVSRMAHYVSGQWKLDTLVAATGTDPYTITMSGVTASSPIGITNEFITCTKNFNSVCTGSSVSVAYNAIGNFSSGNKFTAQLSDATGNFSSPVNIGSKQSILSGTINCTIPTSTTQGSGYRIRVISSNPSFSGSNNGYNISINNCNKINGIAQQSLKIEEFKFFKVYPNPTSNDVNLTCTVDDDAATRVNLQIIALNGQKIYSTDVPVSNHSIIKTIHFSNDTPNGIYFLKLSINQKVIIEKIVFHK